MSAPSAQDLLNAMEQAGLNVRTLSGWETRGGSWRLRNPFRATSHPNQPIAIMQHHTAPPVPFPIGGLVGSKLKANINTKPDGTVWLLAYRACNYSSGMGSSVVLNEVLKGVVPTRNALVRNLKDNINGNPYFFNFENDHPGDGSPMPRVQLDAIVTATRVSIDHFNLPVTSDISHAEWTRRKSDPYWDGSRRAIETIRQRVEEDMSQFGPENWDEADWAKMHPRISSALMTAWVPDPDGVPPGQQGNPLSVPALHYNTVFRRSVAQTAANLVISREASIAQAEGRTLSKADIETMEKELAETFGWIERD